MRAGLEGPAGPRPPYTWDYVKRLKDATDMKVILKGIVTAEEAELALEHGADGIFVSNHGGRAENSLWSSIDSLPIDRSSTFRPLFVIPNDYRKEPTGHHRKSRLHSY